MGMFQQTLTDFLSLSLFGFLLVFTRFGTALMLMPGIGDTYVSTRVKLHVSLAISFVLFPMLIPLLPQQMPGTFAFFMLLGVEFVIGLFIGTIARVLMMALDTAGMTISVQSGLGAAQMFNPGFATQGSLIGAFLTLTGMVLLFVTNLHHMMIMGIFESYRMFPVGEVPNTGDMADMMSRVVSLSFLTGIKIAVPFIVMMMVLYVGMGVLARLMPQIQVFMVALPLQIMLAISTLIVILSAMMLFFLRHFESGLVFFLNQGG